MNPFAKTAKSKEGSKKDKFLEMIQAKKAGPKPGPKPGAPVGKRKFSAGGYADGGMPTQGMMPQRPPVMPLQAQSMPMQPQGMPVPQQAFKRGGPVRRGYGKARGA